MAKTKKKKKEKTLHPFRENIEVVLFAIIMAMGLKVFAVEAYQIPTGSMQPTLMGTELLDPATKRASGSLNDRVLVDKISYFFRDPQRWEVVVFRYPLLTHNNYVKRLVGMPNEELWIFGGNLYARELGSVDDFQILVKPWKVMLNIWKKVLPGVGDDATQWHGWRTIGDYTTNADGHIQFNGSGRSQYTTSIRNGYLHGYPDEVYFSVPNVSSRSRHAVGDLRLQFQLDGSQSSGTFSTALNLGKNIIGAEFDASGKLTLNLPTGELRELEIPANFNGEVDIAFWDNTLRVALDDDVVFRETMQLEPHEPRNNSMQLVVDGSNWTLSPVKVSRDLHYLPPRQNAAPVFEVTGGHYFMLGDNTQNSLDSRDWQREEFSYQDDNGETVKIAGDHLQHGSDPTYNNPRWNMPHDIMTLRDEFGNLNILYEDQVKGAADVLQHAPLVPRNYFLGRALAVFMPLKPIAPTNRFTLVQ
ncbi:MAG: signal peptidase I [Myxococcota bacterium]|jgi:signal peptidase I